MSFTLTIVICVSEPLYRVALTIVARLAHNPANSRTLRQEGARQRHQCIANLF
jgi:hypothetical protein